MWRRLNVSPCHHLCHHCASPGWIVSAPKAAVSTASATCLDRPPVTPGNGFQASHIYVRRDSTFIVGEGVCTVRRELPEAVGSLPWMWRKNTRGLRLFRRTLPRSTRSFR
ncbi:hypothetical protein MRX96_004936 [Rhipicephalus microplus]